MDEKSVVYSHSNEIPNKFAVYVKERKCEAVRHFFPLQNGLNEFCWVSSVMFT